MTVRLLDPHSIENIILFVINPYVINKTLPMQLLTAPIAAIRLDKFQSAQVLMAMKRNYLEHDDDKYSK